MDAAVAEARLGQTIDRYRLEAVLGAGGFGAVYRARHLVMDRLVALKLLHSGLARSDSVRERFLREAQILARLHHPNVVGVHDCGITREAEVFLAMELLSGEDLASRLHRLGTMDPATTLAVIDAVLDGLGVAHAAGIVHRDLKPANVFLAREGAVERPKLVDFGISKAGDDRDRLTRTGALLGTPVYMAPETFALGTSAVDARADLYAVGVMLFEMLSGRLPYDAPSYEGLVVKMATEPPPPLASVAPVSSELAAIVDCALRRDPAARFADAASMRAALDGVRERNATGPLAHAGTMMAPSVPPGGFRGPTAPATPRPAPSLPSPAPTASASWAASSTAPAASATAPAASSTAPTASSYTPGSASAPWSGATPPTAPPASPPPSGGPSPAWSGSAATPSWTTGAPGTASAPSRPVAVGPPSRMPWGWIAFAVLVPLVLLGSITVFVGTCSGGIDSTPQVAAVPGPVGAPMPPSSERGAVVVTPPTTEAKPPLPGEVAAGSPPIPSGGTLVEPTTVASEPTTVAAPPTTPPSPTASTTPPAAATSPPTAAFGRDVRLREPRVVGDVDPELVHGLFDARRASLQRCRGQRDEVAYVSLMFAGGRISMARSNPNVDGSDTEAARCVANVMRGGDPFPSGHGIVMIEVELAAEGE